MFKTPRAAVLLVFAAFGILVGSHLGALPLITRVSGVSDQFYGSTLSVAMLCTLGALSACGTISHHFDHRSVLLVTLPTTLLALGFALVANTPVLFALSFIALASSLTFVDMNMNAEGSVIETEAKRPIFTTFHASVSFAMAAGSILSSFLGVSYGTAAPLVAAVPAVALAMFWVWRYLPARVPHAERMDGPPERLPYRSLVTFGIIMGFSNASEMAAALWAGQLLANLRPELIAYSGLGVTFFGLCAGLLRLFGDGLRARFGDIFVLTAGLAVATVGFAILALGPGFAVSVIAFAAVGAGTAPSFPVLLALAGRHVQYRQAAAISFTSAVSMVPRFVTPTVLGYVAASYGLSALFAVSTVLAAFALTLAILLLMPMERRQRGASVR